MRLCGFEVGLDRPLFLIAGPDTLESEQLCLDVAGKLREHTKKLGMPYIFKGSFDKADSELVVMAFAHDSRTVGNAATEIVKYFFQLHYDIKKDYRLPNLLERGNFYSND